MEYGSETILGKRYESSVAYEGDHHINLLSHKILMYVEETSNDSETLETPILTDDTPFVVYLFTTLNHEKYRNVVVRES